MEPLVSMESAQSSSDAELLDQFAARDDRAAFAELVRRHARWVFASAYRQLRDRHLAEDATQAVFLLLLRKGSDMRSHPKISGWLFNATRYTVQSIRRAESRREKHERQAAKPDTAEKAIDVSEYLDSAVAKLPAKDRQIVLLRFYQGMEFAEIATAISATEDATRRRLSRAIEKLRPRISMEDITAASAMGGSMVPAHLQQQLIQNAAGNAAASHAGLIAKGATHLMNAMKIKIAAAICAGAGVLGVLTYAVIGQVAARSNEPVATAAPTAMDEFRQKYAVNAQHALVHIKPPLPAAREMVYRQQHAYAVNAPPAAMIVHWSASGKPEFWYSSGAALSGKNLVQAVLEFFPQEVEGDIDALSVRLPGDFAERSDVTMPPTPAMEPVLCRDIQNILVRDTGTAVLLNLRTVPRKVIVLSGQWKYSPLDADAASRKEVEFYSRAWNSRRVNMMGDSPVAMWAKWLGNYINQQVVIEATGVPENIHFKASATPADMRIVLDHVQQQTGLKWSEETRNVERLFVEAQ